MKMRIAHLAANVLLVLPGALAGASESAAGIEFLNRIRPLLVEVCVDCHGAKKQKGDLRLDSRAGWTKGGASGAVIVPGKPDDSLLVSAVRYWDKKPADAAEACTGAGGGE